MLSEALADLLKYLVGVASPSVFLSTKPSRAKGTQVSPDPGTRGILTRVSSAFSSHGGADTAQADVVRGVRIEPQDQSPVVREVARLLIGVLLLRLWSPTFPHSSGTVS